MVLRYHKTKSITTNIHNAIGPSGDPLRTVANHNDANCRYVAPNGSDTAAGTYAAPYLTLDKAISMLGGSYTFITILRNGYPGDMVFVAPDQAIPAGTTLQVESGHIATLRRTSYSMRSFTAAFGDINALAVDSTGRFVVANSSGSNLIYYSDDGITWNTHATPALFSSIHVDASDRWVAGAVAGTIYYSNNGLDWVASSAPLKNWTSVKGANGKWIAQEFSTPQYLYYSTDRIVWHSITTPNEFHVGIADGNSLGRMVVQGSNETIFYSDDAINWFPANAPKIIFSAIHCNANDRWVGITFAQAGWYYSDDGINWFAAHRPSFTSFDLMECHITSNNDGKFYAIVKTDEAPIGGSYKYFLVTSNDGIQWDVSGLTWASTLLVCCISPTNRCLIVSLNPDYTATIKNYFDDNVLTLVHPNFTINGIDVDGNYTINTGISGNNIAEVSVQWCRIEKVTQSGIYGCDSPTISHSIVGNLLRNGCSKITNGIVHNNIFHHINGIAVDHYGNTLSIQHNTFYQCDTGIKINDAIVTLAYLKNNIFANGVYDIVSNDTTLTFSNSVSQGLLIKSIPDASCIRGAMILFHDELAHDFHLCHLEESYPIASPGVTLSDTHTDAGAWHVSFSMGQATWETVTWGGDEISVKRGLRLIRPDSGITFSNALKRTVQGRLRTLEITPTEVSHTKMVYEMEQILLEDQVIQAFLVDYGIHPPTHPGTFSWQHPTDAKGLVHLTIHPSDRLDVDYFFAHQQPEGWFVMIHSIDGITPTFYRYPMKIVEYTKAGTLHLENFTGKYSGVGMATNPDGLYTYDIVKGMFCGIVEYKGTSIEELSPTRYVFVCPDLLQTFVPNQWQGFFLCLDYTAPLGSRTYFRIQSNTGDTFVCTDPFTHAEALVPHSFYYSVIDLCMVKSEPSDYSSASKKIGQFGKHGNDWYSTEVTREENPTFTKSGYLIYNEKGQSIILVESEETDGDGL